MHSTLAPTARTGAAPVAGDANVRPGLAGRPPARSRRPAPDAACLPPRRRDATPRRGASLSTQALPVPTGPFDIPAAPILIPPGPWKAVEGGVCAPKGFRANGMHAGLRASGPKADLALVIADEPASAAGVFTKNVMAAAPVAFCKAALAASPGGTARAVLVNAGQANAATGAAGAADCEASAAALKAALPAASAPGDILLLSTGVIGRRIKLDALAAALPALVSGAGPGPADAHRAAVAITTTDTVSKAAALEVELAPGGPTVRVGGMAKGSGMIHPDMATMLAVLTTDAAVAPPLWRSILRAGAAASFNQITVDGDTSTNDTVIGLASGKAAGCGLMSSEADPGVATLTAAVTALLQGLAKAIAWDGEGATCLVEVAVAGAESDADARQVAKAVVGSSLVKAAIFGGDPNWGRIACAAGYAGVPFPPDALNITLGPIALMSAGQPLAFDEAAASAYLKGTAAVHGTVAVGIEVGPGPGAGLAWGCDLSYEYVTINAEYTT